MKIKMLRMTTYEGKTLAVGGVYEIDEEVAVRWKKRGIATVRKDDIAKLAPEEPKKEEPQEEVGEEDVPTVSDGAKPERLSGNSRTSGSGRKTSKKGK